MKNNSYKSCLLAGLIFFIVTVVVMERYAEAACDTPATSNTICYRGYLADLTTTPSTTRTITFRIYDAATGGVKIWEEAQANITITFGRFAVELGTGALFPADFHSYVLPRWLGTWISGEASERAPREAFTTAPSALRSTYSVSVESVPASRVIGTVSSATTAETALSVPASGITGSVPVANLPIDSMNFIRNQSTPQQAGDYNISGHGTLGGNLVVGGTAAVSGAGSFSSGATISGNVEVLNGDGVFRRDVSIDRDIILSAGSIKNARLENLAAAPAGSAGRLYYDTGARAVEYYDGSGWFPLAKKVAKVAIVAVSGGDYTDPVSAMSAIVTWCGTPSASNPCLLKIMPGVYTITQSLIMQPYVDIEGSGENVTKIKGSIGGDTGIIRGASNAGLRFLTVENARLPGDNLDTIAIRNSDASPIITHVSAIASNGINSYGIYNSGSSAIIRDVNAIATGGQNAIAVLNRNSSLAMENIIATATGTGANTGVSNGGTYWPLIDITPSNQLKIRYHEATLRNVTATASGGQSNYGISNSGSSRVKMSDVISRGTGTAGYGVYESGSIVFLGYPTMYIDHSIIEGTVNSIFVRIPTLPPYPVAARVYVGSSKLIGKVTANTTCAGVYDRSYSFYANTCP